MDYSTIKITKSWRKTLSMSFNRDWILEVKAPRLLRDSQIRNFIEKNTPWIEKHSHKLKQRQNDKNLYFFWKELEWQDTIEDIEKYYKSEAKNYITQRCRELADEYWFTYNALRITSAKTRWGSCSSQKTLNFSYRLIMSPPDCIDYVIVHELCHLRQMNHSSKFWNEVVSIMPEYKVHEKHLKSEWWRYTL